MKMARSFLLGLVALATYCQPGQAAIDILYFVDLNVGTDRMAQALAALPGTYTVTTAASIPGFTASLTGGGFEMAIFHQQNSGGSDYDAAFAAIAAHIAGGGLAIANDWTLTAAHAAPFEANFTGGTNEPSFTVTEAGLLPGLSNPVDLSNPGWGIFSTSQGTIGGGSASAVFPSTAAAIVLGNSGRTYFNGFLSDTFVDGPEGVQLYINEIVRLAEGVQQAVPEATSMVVWSLLLGVVAIRRKRS
jgi:hypothetical protein